MFDLKMNNLKFLSVDKHEVVICILIEVMKKETMASSDLGRQGLNNSF